VGAAQACASPTYIHHVASIMQKVYMSSAVEREDVGEMHLTIGGFIYE